MPSPMEYAEQYLGEGDLDALRAHRDKLQSRMSAASRATRLVYQEVIDFCVFNIPPDDEDEECPGGEEILEEDQPAE